MLNQAVFSPCGRLIAAVDDGSLHIWNARTGRLLATKSDLSYHMVSVAFSPCGTALAVSGLQNEIDIWEIPNQ